MSLLNILPSPKSFPFIIPYLLLENTISVTKFSAILSGLFHFDNTYDWVVTKKSGRRTSEFLIRFEESADNEKTTKMKKKSNRIYKKELALALLLLAASARSLLLAHGVHFYFLLFQGLSFFVVGLDLIGEH